MNGNGDKEDDFPLPAPNEKETLILHASIDVVEPNSGKIGKWLGEYVAKGQDVTSLAVKIERRLFMFAQDYFIGKSADEINALCPDIRFRPRRLCPSRKALNLSMRRLLNQRVTADRALYYIIDKHFDELKHVEAVKNLKANILHNTTNMTEVITLPLNGTSYDTNPNTSNSITTSPGVRRM